MSLPKISLTAQFDTGIELNLDLVTYILATIALGEAGLSHIMFAEGEKMQAALEYYHTGSADSLTAGWLTGGGLIRLNASLATVMDAAATLEEALQDKLDFLVSELEAVGQMEYLSDIISAIVGADGTNTLSEPCD
jgi:hypothetical protein